MRIVAILTVHNEELYLRRCLTHLFEQGIEVYVIDNDSTDRTREIARSFLGRGVIQVERFPRRGMFELERVLRREEQVAEELGADWYLHHDADEIRQAPNPYRTLREGIEAVDREGYNAVNFDEFVFVPTSAEENFEHDRYVEEMQYYYFFEAGALRQIKAWKYTGQQVDLHSTGGHQVQFPKRRVYPRNFILRHYMALSRSHLIRKYCGRSYSEAERRDRGWHNVRASLRPDQVRLPSRERLCRVSIDNSWDRSDPWRRHAVFESVTLLPQNSAATNDRTSVGLLPAPFVVGLRHSGTNVLGRTLDRHPELTVLSETNWVSALARRGAAPTGDGSAAVRSLSDLERERRFGIERDSLERRLAELGGANDGRVLRLFYELCAEVAHKPRWGDATPEHVTCMEWIEQWLPQARFVHVIRDGRDVAVAERVARSSPQAVEDAAGRWLWTISQARRQAQGLRHFLEIRLESLVDQPASTLKTVCDFLDLPWVAELPAALEESVGEESQGGNEQGLRSRLGRWKREMTRAEQQRFEAIAGSMLRELCYDVAETA